MVAPEDIDTYLYPICMHICAYHHNPPISVSQVRTCWSSRFQDDNFLKRYTKNKYTWKSCSLYFLLQRREFRAKYRELQGIEMFLFRHPKSSIICSLSYSCNTNGESEKNALRFAVIFNTSFFFPIKTPCKIN
jgi:hypothetical protein